MDYDRILTQLGELGRWQRRNAALLWLPAMTGGINIMIAAYAVMPPREYRCQNDCDGEGFGFEFPGHDKADLFPSFDQDSEDYNDQNPDYCKYYQAVPQKDGACLFNKSVTLSCKRGAKFAYQPFEMTSTVALDNDLVCGNYYWTILVDEFFMLGLMIGSTVFGVMSDRLGRRHALFIAIITCTVGNLLGIAMPNHWSYTIPRILASAGGVGSYILAFTMTLEYCGVRETVPGLPWVTLSTFMANLITVPNALGEVIPSLVALGLRDWKEYTAAVSAFIAFSAIVWFFVPESPRWLIAKGKTEEARELIENAARVNKVKLSPEIFEADPNEARAKEAPTEDIPVYGFTDMFRRSQLPITLSLFICWPVITLLFYGLTLSADKIKMTDNVFLSYSLVCLLEIPAYIALPLVIDVVGRKPLFFLTQFIPGVCCIVAAFLTPGTVIFAILALGAKMGASAAFNVTYIYTAQLYPTSIRSSAVGACSTMARVGGMLSPVIGKYLISTGMVDEKLPMILFGAFGIVGGLCALILPDTVGFPLPNTFEDIEEIKKNSKPIWELYRPSK